MSINDWKDKKIEGRQFTAFNYDQDSLGSKEYPYAMVCFLIDDETTIAVGSDPLSPKDFRDRNENSIFIVDFSIPPRKMLTMNGYRIIYYAKKVGSDISKQNSNMKLDFVFKSSDHIRYENGKHVSGPHGGAGRAVKVEPNINGGEGVSVTMYNLDGSHPVWQNNVQMAPKQMKVTEETNDKIVLRGYGYDAMGGSFADYGLTIKLKNGELENCILHMHDRGVDIEYLP